MDSNRTAIAILSYDMYIGNLPDNKQLKNITYFVCYTESAVTFVKEYIDNAPYVSGTEKWYIYREWLLDYLKDKLVETWVEQVAE